MTNRVLAAIDLSENSMRVVEYLGKMLSCHASPHITLLHIIREPSPDIIPDSGERQAVLERMRADALKRMEEAGNRITSHGIPNGNVRLKLQVCSKLIAVAQLILYEQQQGGYGTLVIGRRGVSKKEQFLFGSVSSTIVREARGCAVWIIE